MQRLLPASALVLLLAGCLSSPSASDGPLASIPLDVEGFVPIQFTGFRFLEQDLGGGESGLRLHADIYLPTNPINATAPTKFPTILLMSPYWGGGTDGNPYLDYLPYDFLVGRLLPRGYAVVFGDLSGNGGSGGCMDFMGPVERESAYNMVEAIAAQDWSDGQVGMFGLSYDGMTQVMAASDQAPHLVTVVPAAALTEAYKGLRMHGVHYSGWHTTIADYEQATLLGPGVGDEPRQAGWIETVQRTPQCMAQNHVGDAATGAYSDYYKARDFRPFGKDVKASVFVTQGFLDDAVKPDNFGAWFNGITTEKKLWLGWWFHEYPGALGAGRDDMYLTFHRWFDHTLYGIDNGIMDGPVVDVQDSQGQWRHEDTWPPADASTTTFAMSSDGRLTTPGEASSGGVPVGGPTAATQLATPSDEGDAGFTSAPLPDGLRIAGVPYVTADFLPSGPSGYVVARLYDGERMVTQGAVNALFANGLDAPQPLQPSVPVRLNITMYPTDWVVLPGSSLRLVLNTMDGQAWFDPDVANPLGFTVFAGKDAVLGLPTITRAPGDVFLTSCAAVLQDAESNCYDPGLKNKGVPEDGYP